MEIDIDVRVYVYLFIFIFIFPSSVHSEDRGLETMNDTPVGRSTLSTQILVYEYHLILK